MQFLNERMLILLNKLINAEPSLKNAKSNKILDNKKKLILFICNRINVLNYESNNDYIFDKWYDRFRSINLKFFNSKTLSCSELK